MEHTDSVDTGCHHEELGTRDYAGSHEDDEGNSLQYCVTVMLLSNIEI